jgi:hypothetical protein
MKAAEGAPALKGKAMWQLGVIKGITMRQLGVIKGITMRQLGVIKGVICTQGVTVRQLEVIEEVIKGGDQGVIKGPSGVTHLAMEALRRIPSNRPSNRRPSAVTVNPPRTGPPEGEIEESAGSR